MEQEKITRRNFLIPLAGLGLAGTLGLGVKLVWDRRPTVLPLRKLLEKVGPYREIGAAYLEKFPEEAEGDTLVSRLLGEIRNHPQTGSMMAEIQRSVQRDFERSETFNLDGWVLSRTEGRLCALALVADPGLTETPRKAIEAGR